MSEAMNPTHGEPPEEGSPEYQQGTTGESPGSSDSEIASADRDRADGPDRDVDGDEETGAGKALGQGISDALTGE